MNRWGAQWGVGLGLLALSTLGCREQEDRSAPSAEIGVFYGGQIQRLSRVEVSNVHPPKIGFRLRAGEEPPQRTSQTFQYFIVYPGPAGRRVTQQGHLTMNSNRGWLDHLIDLAPATRPRLVNVRITSQERLVADRALYLIPAR